MIDPKNCAHEYGPVDRSCGVRICVHCGDHKGLARCFCGWSESGLDGRQELIEMGETIDDPDSYDRMDMSEEY